MVAPTSSHPSYRLSSVAPAPFLTLSLLPAFKVPLFDGYCDDDDEEMDEEQNAGHLCYLLDIVQFSTDRARIVYEERVPDRLKRTRRYDYKPPGPSPLRQSHVHRRGRGGKGHGKARRDRYRAKLARREAARAAEPPAETSTSALPALLSSMTVKRKETKAVDTILTLRKSKTHLPSVEAHIKKNTRTRTRARRIRLLELEERAINGP